MGSAEGAPETRVAGEACWFVAETFCGGKVQGTYADTLGTCINCDFFQCFDLEHRYRMSKRFQPPATALRH